MRIEVRHNLCGEFWGRFTIGVEICMGSRLGSLLWDVGLRVKTLRQRVRRSCAAV